MKLTSFSVHNHQFTILVFLCLAAIGFNAFREIPRSEDPKLLIPASTVIVVCPGANAVEMERLVARPVEDSIKELDDLHRLTTTVQDGLAIVGVEFYYGKDPDTKYNDVMRQVNAIRGLPASTTSVEVRRWQTSNVAALQLALVSPDASYARRCRISPSCCASGSRSSPACATCRNGRSRETGPRVARPGNARADAPAARPGDRRVAGRQHQHPRRRGRERREALQSQNQS